MSYDPSKPGLGEATRNWLVSAIQANLSSLNTALQRDGLLTVDITPAMVLRGDPKTMPLLFVAPLLICVSGGGGYGTDMEIEQQYIALRYRHNITSQITVYLHPDALPVPTGNDLESGREILIDRVCDWLRNGIFNTTTNVNPTLASTEYGDAAGDHLNQAHISSIEMGQTQKGFAGSQMVYYARLVHTAWIT